MVYSLASTLGWFIDAINRRPVEWFLMQEPVNRSWMVFGLAVLWLLTWWFYRHPIDSLRRKIRLKVISMRLEKLLGVNDDAIKNIIREASKGKPVELPEANHAHDKPSIGSRIRLNLMEVFEKLLSLIVITMYVIESIVLVFVLFFI